MKTFGQQIHCLLDIFKPYQRIRSGTPNLRLQPTHDLKDLTASVVGVAWTVLKLSKALVGFVIIGDRAGSATNTPRVNIHVKRGPLDTRQP